MLETRWLIAIALFLDIILGDPRCMPHPVRWIGALIVWVEKFSRNSNLPEKLSGWVLALTVILSILFITSYAINLANAISPLLGYAVEVWMIYTAISLKSLRQEAMKIKQYLAEKSLPDARKALSMIVGRDTGKLKEKEIVRATVETVAENFVDGIVSPLFFASIGGGPLALTYKAINTLDSMVGYKNERYINIGRASAIIDDTANFIPARISILLMSIGAFFCGHDYKNAFTIGWRDRLKHPSPNAAHPEAAMAGALGVQLGGSSSYQGTKSDKPILGEKHVPLDKDHICKSLNLVQTASFVFLLLLLLF